MDNEAMKLNPKLILEYTNFLDKQCVEIKSLCNSLQADLTLAYYALDELSGKEAALAIQRNINEVSKNMPIYTELFVKMLQVRQKVIDAGQIIGNRNGGGNHGGI